LLILSFRGALEAPQGIVYAGRECFRAECFEDPTPPAWREDEVSAILDATGGRVDGSASDVRFHSQFQWKREKSIHAEYVSFGIDLFDLEGEAQGAAQDFSGEVDGLACAGWTVRLTPFCLDRGIEPLGIAFPLDEVLPDHLNRGRDDGGGTDCQTHGLCLLSMRSGNVSGRIGLDPHSSTSVRRCVAFLRQGLGLAMPG